MRKLVLSLLFVLVFLPARDAQALTPLWYNGDVDYVNGLTSESNNLVPNSRVYDDFWVPAGGWTVNTVYSHFLTQGHSASLGHWEIRAGLSPGDGGTLIAGGMSPATQVEIDFFKTQGHESYVYLFAIENLDLTLQEGRYWLTIAPVASGQQFQAFLATTSGSNALGLPAGDNGNAYFDSLLFGAEFLPVADFGSSDSYDYDFSYGINGVGRIVRSSVPEPSTIWLVGSGLLGGIIRRRKLMNIRK